VWEYVEDHFAPLPGFEIHYLYDDFSAPCFDGWHTLIMGGSWVSTGDLASSFARYHFRRHFFQHLGFRYVALPAGAPPEPFPGASTVTNLWEGMSTVSGDVTNGYAPREARVPYPSELLSPDNACAYATSVARLAAKAYLAHTGAGGAPAADAAALAGATVLHLGCGVGGGTLELARAGFGRVIGVDVREPAVRHARVLQHHGQLEYERVEEGVLTSTALVRAGAGVNERARVAFFVGDARALSPEVLDQGPFDVVLVDGFLARLTQPLDLVAALPRYVRPGGLAVVSSNNDWSPAVTPRNSWLGGFKMNGEDCTTLGMLKYHWKRAFDLAEACDVPRLTRHHARRFTLDVMQASVWRRHAAAGPPAAAEGAQ
jgi:2-polyprenyl-3-methyl-5-hydroxy-6-metoxy-1,4-benzoquinol methylase